MSSRASTVSEDCNKVEDVSSVKQLAQVVAEMGLATFHITHYTLLCQRQGEVLLAAINPLTHTRTNRTLTKCIQPAGTD